MNNTPEDMILAAQIAFRDKGLQLLQDSSIQPADVLSQIYDISDEEQYFAQTINPIDEIMERLKAFNRPDLMDINEQFMQGNEQAINTPIDHKFVEFYLNNLLN